MNCHATGESPSRQHPRRDFVYLHTPYGPLWFCNKEICTAWVDRLPQERKDELAKHDPMTTPGVLPVGILLKIPQPEAS